VLVLKLSVVTRFQETGQEIMQTPVPCKIPVPVVATADGVCRHMRHLLRRYCCGCVICLSRGMGKKEDIKAGTTQHVVALEQVRKQPPSGLSEVP
jgi:hypothetical protein